MKKISFFTLLLSSAVLLLAAASCGPKNEDIEPEVDLSGVTFTLKAGVPQINQVDVTVSHNGDDASLTWYSFVTEDINTTLESLVSSEAPKVGKDALHVGQTRTLRIKNLDGDKNYRYVAFGIDATGKTYGVPGEVKFTTKADLNLVAFSAEASNVGKHEADITVSHTGKDEYEWLYVVTEDLESEASDILLGALSDIESANIETGTQKTLNLSDLKAGTQMRFVVGGYDAEAQILFGTPAEATFTTEDDFDAVVFTAEVISKSDEDALIKVASNGSASYTWYGFVTDDTQTDVEGLISAALEGITADDLKSGNPVEVRVDGLSSSTTYRYIVAGVQADLTTYGTPADLTFETAAVPIGSYNSYLGAWQYPTSDGTETWVITEKVAGESYYISGISGGVEPDGGVYPTAIYDPATKSFSLSKQDLGTFSSGGTEYKDVLANVFWTSQGMGNNQSYDVTDLIFTATMNDSGDIDLKVENDSYGRLEGFGILYTDGSKWYTYNSRATHLSSDVLLRPKDASEGYKKWIGTFRPTLRHGSGDDEVVEPMDMKVSQNIPDQNFIVSGFGMDIVLDYDPATESILWKFAQVGGNSSYEFYTSGVTDQQTVAVGGDDNIIARFTMEGNEVTVTPVSYENEGTVYTAQSIGIVGYNLSQGGWALFSDVNYMDIPHTFTKAGGAGTSSLRKSGAPVRFPYRPSTSVEGPDPRVVFMIDPSLVR